MRTGLCGVASRLTNGRSSLELSAEKALVIACIQREKFRVKNQSEVSEIKAPFSSVKSIHPELKLGLIRTKNRGGF